MGLQVLIDVAEPFRLPGPHFVLVDEIGAIRVGWAEWATGDDPDQFACFIDGRHGQVLATSYAMTKDDATAAVTAIVDLLRRCVDG